MTAESAAPKAGGFNLGKVQVQKAVDQSDGVWIHLNHPVDGHPLYVGGEANEWGKIPDEDNPGEAKPCRVKILSAESVRYRKQEFKINREVARVKRRVDFEAADEASYEKAAALIVDIQNVPDDTGRMLSAKSKEDKMILLRSAVAFANQILISAEESGRFFGSGSGGASPPVSVKAG